MFDPIALLIAICALMAIAPIHMAMRKYRGRGVLPVGRWAFISMSLGLFSIAFFYISIAFLGAMPHLVIMSRFIFALIILSSAGMGVGVLAYRREGDKGRERSEKE